MGGVGGRGGGGVVTVAYKIKLRGFAHRRLGGINLTS